MTDREEKIRQRAYGIWEQEGHPHGRAEDHWYRAAREVTEQPEPAASARAELVPDIGEAPSLQPAETVAGKKKAAPRRKAEGEAAATRKPTVKKG
jgi:hypothetical protein